jgi:hypothetical protein
MQFFSIGPRPRITASDLVSVPWSSFTRSVFSLVCAPVCVSCTQGPLCSGFSFLPHRFTPSRFLVRVSKSFIFPGLLLSSRLPHGNLALAIFFSLCGSSVKAFLGFVAPCRASIFFVGCSILIDFLRAPPWFYSVCSLCMPPELFFACSGSSPRLLFPLNFCCVFIFLLVDSICTVRFCSRLYYPHRGLVTSCDVCLEFCSPAQSSRRFSQDLVFAAALRKFILCCKFWLRSHGCAFVFCCSVSYMISVQ